MNENKWTEEALLKRLEEMEEASYPTEEELEKMEISPDFVARMHKLIDEEIVKEAKRMCETKFQKKGGKS